MPEICVNIHMHTRYSDGSGTHREIALAALESNLDAVIVTDHNVYVNGVERYYSDGPKRVLLLVGEEIHDQARQPQKSHLLVLGAGMELAHLAGNLGKLIETVHERGGIAFAAHPNDPAAPFIHEEALTWEDWGAEGLDGIEIWNGMSEFKARLKSIWHALYYVYAPNRIARGPFPETMGIWDQFLASGRRLAAIGGSDAHALEIRRGLLKRTVFPYTFHFRTINTHILLEEPLSGDLIHDRKMILDALKKGRSFIANDYPVSGKNFGFSASGLKGQVSMGGSISRSPGVTLQIHLPSPAECLLIKHGQLVMRWHDQSLCTYLTSEPGAYRVEAYRKHQGRLVGWIFSNPIYVT